MADRVRSKKKVIENESELKQPDQNDGGKAAAPKTPTNKKEQEGTAGDGAGEMTLPKALAAMAPKDLRIDALYSGPYYGPGDPKKRGPSVGPYMIGLKRAVVRWHRGSPGTLLRWQDGGNYNATYNDALQHDVGVFKDHKGIDTPGSVWGQGAHEALETAIRGGGAPKPFSPTESVIDAVVLHLFEDAYDAKHPGLRNIKALRKALAIYLEAMEHYDSIWHYLQQRPIGSMGVVPSHGGRDDCSALCIAAAYMARRETGIFMPDPAGYGYAGFGNSVTLFTTNQARQIGLSATFEVGDTALYGPGASRHATMCRKRGTADAAIFTSHGSEAGPDPTRVLYRNDLYAIVRPAFVN